MPSSASVTRCSHLGFPIREFTADVRDGVPYGSVMCTLSLTSAEFDAFPAMLSCARRGRLGGARVSPVMPVVGPDHESDEARDPRASGKGMHSKVRS